MRGREILRKQAELRRMEESLQTATHRVQEISADIQRLKKSRHWKRLIAAGKIVDKADLLDRFNPDRLYVVLMENRERICDNGFEETF